jgi:hypothetical protein
MITTPARTKIIYPKNAKQRVKKNAGKTTFKHNKNNLKQNP